VSRIKPLDWLRAQLGALLHPAVLGSDAEPRHLAFLVAHIGAALLALAALPIALAGVDRPGAAHAALFAWSLTPLGPLLLLSLTGRLAAAQLGSSLCGAAALTHFAGLTGGNSSEALNLFGLLPVAAALSGETRLTLAAAGLALSGWLVLVVSGWAGLTGADAGLGRAASLAAPLALAASAALILALAHLARLERDRLRAQAEQHRLLAEHTGDLITSHGRNGAIVFASPSSRTLLGLAPEALMGQGLFDRVHVADRPAFLRAMSSDQDENGTAEFRLRVGPDGAAPHFVWVETRCRPHAGTGAAAGAIAVTRNIEDRKRTEAELLAAREEAEQASEAKTRFLAHMSHELRTPLNAIIGFSDLLGQEQALFLSPEKRLDYARLINDSGAHLLQVVNDILDVSRIEAGRLQIAPEAFNLADLMEGCRRMLETQAQEGGVSLVSLADEGLPELVADRRACRQILINLLSNAVKFTERGGEVIMSARAEGGWAVVTVADTGVGIPAREISRLGQPFVQADSSYARRFSGTGLGLSVVKGLVALHGGTMSIASEVGRGTRVTLRLPLVTGAVPVPGAVVQLKRA